MEENKDLFESEVGTLEGYTAHLEVQGNATLLFHKPRSVPYTLITVAYRCHEHAVFPVKTVSERMVAVQLRACSGIIQCICLQCMVILPL